MGLLILREIQIVEIPFTVLMLKAVKLSGSIPILVKKTQNILTVEAEVLQPSQKKWSFYVVMKEISMRWMQIQVSIKWTKNLLTDFDGKRPTWGFAGSPLFVNDKLILETGSPDGSLVCLNAESGI